MKKYQIPSVIILLFLGIYLNATPPSPNIGMRWVLLEDYSDEFDGTSLNLNKWNDFHPWWNGRAPAIFSKDAISVSNGKLVIENGILDTPQGNYKYFGGAVTSKKREAHYGYFECNFIASMTKMSTTFWLANQKMNLVPGNCETDSYSQELDIQECIGDPGTKGAFMRDNMGSNTHFRYVACGASSEKFYSKTPSHKKLSSGVGVDYHTYGAWWKDAHQVTFYADNEKGSTVKFNTEISDTPFDRPMFINMVTETYAWTDPVIESELLNPDLNKSYYDWVRTYKEVPIDEAVADFAYPDIYEEDVLVEDVLTYELDSLTFTYEFKANQKRELNLSIVDKDGAVLYAEKLHALKGFGKDLIGVKFDTNLEKGVNYTYLIDIRPADSSAEYIISGDTVDVLKEIYKEEVTLSKTPKVPADTIKFQLEYTADADRDLTYTITDDEGVVKKSEKRSVARGVVKEDLKIGLGFEYEDNVTYTVVVDLRTVDGLETDIITSDSFEMINKTIALISNKSASSISLFPNPAQNSITLEGVVGEVKIKIYSLAGQRISTKVIDENGVLDVSDLKSGVYLIKVGAETIKFVKG